MSFGSTKYFETPLGLPEIHNLLEKVDSDKDNMEGLKHVLAVCLHFILQYLFF